MMLSSFVSHMVVILSHFVIFRFKAGSENSVLVKKKSNSISVGEFYRDPVLQRCSANSQRHSSSLVSSMLFILSAWSLTFS